MASGLCSRARAKPWSGSPESMISYVSLSSRRISRRNASSSSTTNNFPIARFLLLAGTGLASYEFGHAARTGRRLLPAVEHGAHLPDKNLFGKWFVQKVG